MPGGGIPKGYIPGPPALAIEVVSPKDRDAEVQEKVLEYLSAGAERVWVVRPSTKTVTMHRPDGTARTLGIDATLTSDDAAFGVDGFALPVAGLFRG
jgi:Uma2 family endonuclease